MTARAWGWWSRGRSACGRTPRPWLSDPRSSFPLQEGKTALVRCAAMKVGQVGWLMDMLGAVVSVGWQALGPPFTGMSSAFHKPWLPPPPPHAQYGWW